MTRHFLHRSDVRRLLVLAAGFALCHGQAGAAGFGLREQSASGMGNAYAGGAASAEDASTVFYNPAGMTNIQGNQLVIAGQMIDFRTKFGNGGSHVSSAIGGTALTGGDGGNAGETFFFPNFYAVTGFGDRFKAGLGINVPYGFATNYQNGWQGRYGAYVSALQSVLINPAVAYKVWDGVSLGAGFQAQFLSAKLNSATDQWATCLNIRTLGGDPAPATTCATLVFSPQGSDGFSQLTGNAWAYGYNLGATYQATDKLRLGASYRSELRYKVTGSDSFQNTAAWNSSPFPTATGLFKFTDAHVGIILPQSASLSGVFQATDRLALMGDVSWTGWKSFNELRIYFDNPKQPTYIQPENWKDTYSFSGGANYKATEHILARAGLGYEQTPVRNMTARLPDAGRWRLAVGGRYTFDKHSAVDIGYSRLFLNRVPVNYTDPAYSSVLLGSYTSSADLASLQYTFSF
jgi:long-chain fatty acid transport protein